MARSELKVVVWAAATFGALLASYSAFRPVRDALILDGDPDQIPWLFTATFVAMLVVAPMWGALVKRGPRRVVPIAFHVFALCAVGFAVVIRADVAPVAVGRVFYVWSAVFNLFVVSVFWSLLADLLGAGERAPAVRTDRGRRHDRHDRRAAADEALRRARSASPASLAMSAVLLELAVIGVDAVRRRGRGRRAMTPRDPPVAGGALAGMRHVAAARRTCASIVGYVLCTACAATFIYLAQAHIVHDLLAGSRRAHRLLRVDRPLRQRSRRSSSSSCSPVR